MRRVWHAGRNTVARPRVRLAAAAHGLAARVPKQAVAASAVLLSEVGDSMGRRQAEQAVTLRSPGTRAARERDARAPVHVSLLDARRRAWAPLALRAVAVALALVGLAGIGSVAGRAPASSSALGSEVGSGAQLAQIGAVEQVIGFAAASAPRDRSRGAPSRLETPGASPAEPAVDTSSPIAGPPRPCAVADPREPPPIPRASALEAPRPPRAPRARPRAVEHDVALPRAASSAASAITPDGRIVLNRATVSELMRLPGVGAKRAAAIVEQRQRLGRFSEISELLRIKGIGPRTLERLLPQLVLD